ncbi:unnamed protein product [Rotaria socialis]|uniref:Uncharacterized protein n=2 Tax=Rotaria socialis TaxID=392032 RepID=A0A820TFP9_9BILA|nr:unnamed protein product [Rotaria socialis]CAF4467343.1 unnamed protein product [Rotaria socialis]
MASVVDMSNDPSIRIQWMWNASTSPFSQSQPAQLCPYSDVENTIIEEAYSTGKTYAMLEKYHIDFKHNLQISNTDTNKQRPVTRTMVNKEKKDLKDTKTAAVPHKACRRLMSEVAKLKQLENGTPVEFILDQTPFDEPQESQQPQSDKIIGRVFPMSENYRLGAFQIEINISAEYPFKVPTFRMITPIYHPNVIESGKMDRKIVTLT